MTSCHPPAASGTTWSILAIIIPEVMDRSIFLLHIWQREPCAFTTASMVTVAHTTLRFVALRLRLYAFLLAFTAAVFFFLGFGLAFLRRWAHTWQRYWHLPTSIPQSLHVRFGLTVGIWQHFVFASFFARNGCWQLTHSRHSQKQNLPYDLARMAPVLNFHPHSREQHRLAFLPRLYGNTLPH